MHIASVITTFALSLGLSLVARAENIRGNGGDAVVCTDGSIYAADYLFALQKGLPIDLPIVDDNSFPSVFQRFEQFTSRLAQIDPLRANRYRKWGRDLILGTAARVDPRLVLADVADSDPPLLPPGCDLRQWAVQPFDRESYGDYIYYIDGALWNSAPPAQAAILAMHEVIYREASVLGHTESNRVRRFVTALLNGRFAEIHADEEVYSDLLSQTGLTPQVLIPGKSLRADFAHFLPTGNLLVAGPRTSHRGGYELRKYDRSSKLRSTTQIQGTLSMPVAAFDAAGDFWKVIKSDESFGLVRISAKTSRQTFTPLSLPPNTDPTLLVPGERSVYVVAHSTPQGTGTAVIRYAETQNRLYRTGLTRVHAKTSTHMIHPENNNVYWAYRDTESGSIHLKKLTIDLRQLWSREFSYNGDSRLLALHSFQSGQIALLILHSDFPGNRLNYYAISPNGSLNREVKYDLMNGTISLKPMTSTKRRLILAGDSSFASSFTNAPSTDGTYLFAMREDGFLSHIETLEATSLEDIRYAVKSSPNGIYFGSFSSAPVDLSQIGLRTKVEGSYLFPVLF